MEEWAVYYDSEGTCWYGLVSANKPEIKLAYQHRGLRIHYCNDIQLLRISNIDNLDKLRFVHIDCKTHAVEVDIRGNGWYTGSNMLYINTTPVESKQWPKNISVNVPVYINGTRTHQFSTQRQYTWREIETEVQHGIKESAAHESQYNSVNVLFGMGPKLYPGDAEKNMRALLQR